PETWRVPAPADTSIDGGLSSPADQRNPGLDSPPSTAGGAPRSSVGHARRLAGMTAMVASALSEVARSDAALRAFLHGLPGVDQVGADQRAALLGTRSI